VTEPDHVSTARAVYDARAEAYVQLVGTALTPAFDAPIDRAVLAAFVEYLTEGTAGPVADVGCGPGRVAAFLAANGLEVLGFDVSEAMLAVARDAHLAPLPRRLARQLTATGFRVIARAEREPGFAHEATRQAFLLARGDAPRNSQPDVIQTAGLER
jgi:SAM-dependent methyltransferase